MPLFFGHRYGIHRAYLSADATTLTEPQMESDHLLVLHVNTGIGAKDPALQAVDAFFQVNDRAHSPPTASLVLPGVASIHDLAAYRYLSPTSFQIHHD
jgi:hypothetical protein